ncbi:MAG: lmo0937 family membrane protein [Bacteroidales bacterium]|nr:lmo0937 family membrane protein [Bacteroidales bacterium]MDD2387417.1 lmo0937 family membrane protein [Bacteroidales bacterium]MDD4150319.1 lmo0937 family membrane protein [Bacteroidales bacterium]MDY0140562.1 lmo0937 family membrane protein [Bacteroidales bacterium]
MNNLLYLVAIILVILWAIGYYVYSASSLIHILLVIAIITVSLRLIRGRNRTKI